MIQTLLIVLACVLAEGEPPIKFVIVHTTDIHGWIAGPKGIANGADLGDLASFTERARQRFEAEGEVFLLVDSGDLVEGTALSDAELPKGAFILEQIKLLKFDALTMGNHDIGHKDTVEILKDDFVPFWKGKYITTNTYLRENGQVANVTFGSRWYLEEKELSAERSARILFFGYMYDFDSQQYDEGSAKVIMVEEVLKHFKDWFANHTMVECDIIVVTAHIDPSDKSLHAIYNYTRENYPNVPIVFLTGHYHTPKFIPDLYGDPNSFAVETRSYLSEVSVITFDLEQGAASTQLANVEKTRLPMTTTDLKAYLDNVTRVQGEELGSFDTETGLHIKKEIAAYTSKLGLDKIVGCTHMTYNPKAKSDANSLYNFFVDKVVPATLLKIRCKGVENPYVFLSNKASLRAPLYNGKVNTGDLYDIDPFGNKYWYFPAVRGHDILSAFNQLLKAENLPAFVMSAMTIKNNSLYTLVVPGYDGKTIQIEKALPENVSSLLTPLCSNISAREALRGYLEAEMPCASDDNNGNGGLRLSSIAAIVLAVIIILAAALAWSCFRKKRARRASQFLMLEDDGISSAEMERSVSVWSGRV